MRAAAFATFVLGLCVSFGARAATIDVSSPCTDIIAVDGACSLREAVRAANTNVAVNECPAGSVGAIDTIYVPGDAICEMSVAGQAEDAALTGDLDITSFMVIRGRGDHPIIDANGLDRVFDLRAGANLTLVDLDVRGGASVLGGIIIAVGTTLTLDSVALRGNNGPAITVAGGTFNARNTAFVGNLSSASQSGSAVLVTGGTVRMSHVTILGNIEQTTGPCKGALHVAAPASVSIGNSILTGTTTSACTGGVKDCVGTIATTGHNVISQNGCVLTGQAGTDLIGFNQGFGQDDTRSPTYAPLPYPTTPAVEGGPASCVDETGAPLLKDQRGRPRPQGAACDIGAVELDEFFVDEHLDLVDDVIGDDRCRTIAGTCSLRAAVQEAATLNYPRLVTLAPGTFKLSLTGSTSTGGDIDVMTPMLIRGAGMLATRIDADHVDRAFELFSSYCGFADLTIENGSFPAGGGGIITGGGSSLTLTRVWMRNNEAMPGGSGGAVSAGGSVYITHSVFTGNNAYSGGAIFASGGVTLIDSTMSNNRARGLGGAIRAGGAAYTTSLYNSTIVDNIADSDDDGSGDGGGLSVISAFRAHASIIANNKDGSGGGTTPDVTGSLESQGYNIFGSTAGFTLTPSGTDLLNVNPLLAPLAGEPPFHAPLAGSPAIDGGAAGACTTQLGPTTFLDIDQRGVARPQGAGCDIGAIEATTSELAVSGAAPATAHAGETFAITWTATNAGPSLADPAALSFALPAGTTLAMATSSQGACTTALPVVTCALGALAAAAQATVTMSVSATAAGSFSAQAAINAPASLDTLSSNDTASVAVAIAPAADLGLAIVQPPQTAVASDVVTYGVDVTNLGPSPVDAALLSITPDESLINPRTAHPSCPVLPCTLPLLPSGTKLRLNVRLDATAVGAKNVTFTLQATPFDGNLANNVATASLEVTAPPPVVIPDTVKVTAVQRGCAAVEGSSFAWLAGLCLIAVRRCSCARRTFMRTAPRPRRP
ncbi:MAG: DUF11 domain-containing protein [Deltaproteobacteria bacterium]|nr:DUF11 domain-containing protein [Deltaproteobacteria bacterium]